MSTSAELGRMAAGVAGQGRQVMAAMRAARSEGRKHAPQIPAAGLVLEVGGGQAPFPRVDLVIDKYPVDDFERAGELGLDFTKPLVVADGQALPVADGSFAYVIASHVLEHATDPERFASELCRVAPAGFVQVPSRESELTFGWPYHPWLIDLEGDKLTFVPKGDQRAPIGEVFHAEFASSPVLRLWWASTRTRWHHSVEWRDVLPVEVDGTSEADRTADFDPERTARVLRDLATRGGGPPALSAPARAALRCPACASGLRDEPEALVCIGCGGRYPRAGAVPMLLAEARTA